MPDTYKFVRISGACKILLNNDLVRIIKDPEPDIVVDPNGQTITITPDVGIPLVIPKGSSIILPGETDPTVQTLGQVAEVLSNLAFFKVADGGGGSVTAASLLAVIETLPGYSSEVTKALMVENGALILLPVQINQP